MKKDKLGLCDYSIKERYVNEVYKPSQISSY